MQASVSIHARQFHSGRHISKTGSPAASLFQSTPANFTAGDSPSGTRRSPASRFQSTPANFTAGDPGGLFRVRRPQRFNPRPPISQRATRRLVRRLGRAVVSIHARQFHSGRRSIRASSSMTWTFQSTPANFTAGDPEARAAHLRRQGVSIHARQFHSGRRLSAAI